MIEKFKSWLLSYPEFQDPSLKEMLDDAIKCYQNGIARASLLLSYNAFLLVIRGKILAYKNIPQKYKQSEWENKVKKLRDDEKFEEELINLLCAGVDKSIFDYGTKKNLHSDFDYWRRRRNDCAHGKNNTITLSNVCAFWTFIMDNYIYYNMEGSLQRSINEYIEFFDPNYTSPNTSDEKIFPHLCDAIHSEEDVKIIMNGIGQKNGERLMELVHRLLQNCRTEPYTKSYLLNINEDALWKYIQKYTDDIPRLYNTDVDATKIRNIWYTKTCQSTWCLPIYTTLLDCQYIKKGDILESMERQINGWKIQGSLQFLDEYKIDILRKNKFREAFENTAFNDLFSTDFNKQSSLCYHTNFYMSVFRNFGISNFQVTKMIDNFNEHGNFPYTLASQLFDEYESLEIECEPDEKRTLKELLNKHK